MRPNRRIPYDEIVEFDLRKAGCSDWLLAGVDEAGRGALAGPLVAAAVICRPTEELRCVRDSKLISEPVRERLYGFILENSLAWGIGVVKPAEVDRLNVLKATLKAMREAIGALQHSPRLVLVDGRHLPQLTQPAEAVTGGDRRSFSIAAASIVAKVTRDRIMREKAKHFPGYGFARNKGYGTGEHIRAIRTRGFTYLHRRSFRVKALAAEE